jgi:hypothetical protein
MKQREMKLTIIKGLILGWSLIAAGLARAEGETQQDPATITHEKKPVSALKVKYSNYMNGPTFEESSGTSINHYGTLKYDLGKDYSLSANFRFDSTFGDKTSAFTLADSYIVLGAPGVKRFSTTFTAQLWASAGISAKSRASRLMSVIQPRLNMERTVGKWTLSNLLISKLYLYDHKAAAQKWGVVGSYLNASYEINKTWTLDFGVYPELSFVRGKATAFNDLASYPGFTVNLSKAVSLSPYLEIMATRMQGKTTSAGAFLSAAIL